MYSSYTNFENYYDIDKEYFYPTSFTFKVVPTLKLSHKSANVVKNAIPSTFCQALTIAYQYVDNKGHRKPTPQS